MCPAASAACASLARNRASGREISLPFTNMSTPASVVILKPSWELFPPATELVAKILPIRRSISARTGAGNSSHWYLVVIVVDDPSMTARQPFVSRWFSGAPQADRHTVDDSVVVSWRADSLQSCSPPLTDSPRSAPATRSLLAAGYAELGQLAAVRRSDLAKLHGMGPKALGIIQDALTDTAQSQLTIGLRARCGRCVSQCLASHGRMQPGRVVRYRVLLLRRRL